MRAYLVATLSGFEESAQSTASRGAPLLPLGDRPFLQHVVERLVGLGCSRIDVALSEQPERVRELLGDGSRWGVSIHYHPVEDGLRPFAPLRALAATDRGSSFLLAHESAIITVELSSALQRSENKRSTFYSADFVNNAERQGWTGWAFLPAESLGQLAPELSLPELPAAIGRIEGRHSPLEEPVEALSARSFEALLQGQALVVSGAVSGLLLGGREVEPGIWLSRNVRLHSSVRVEAPVYIGEDCAVHRGAKIGPNVCIGAGSVVEEGVTIVDSLVLPSTYISAELELQSVIVESERLITLSHGVDVAVDEALLGRVRERVSSSRKAAMANRAIATALLPLSTIVSKVTNSFCNRAVRPRTLDGVVDLDEPSFDDLLCRVLPELSRVVRGEVSLVGVRPRSREELSKIPDAWRELIGRSKPGLISEAQVAFGAEATAEELYVAEAYYSHHESIATDFDVLRRYLAKALEGA